MVGRGGAKGGKGVKKTGGSKGKSPAGPLPADIPDQRGLAGDIPFLYGK